MMTATLKNKASATTGKGLDRAQDILACAREILAREGYAGLSMRRVAVQAGISLSNVQHYYPNKDLLLEALLLYTMDTFQARIDAISASMADAAPLQRFVSTIDMFLEGLTDPVTHALFFEIWALASRNEFASRLMDRMLARERKTIYNLVRGLNGDVGDDELKRRAVLIIAQVEGLMLFRLDRDKRRAEFIAVRESLRKAVVALATG